MKIILNRLIIAVVAIVALSLNANAQTLPPPEGLQIENYQREIVLKWNKSSDEATQWQVKVNDADVFTATTNRFIVTKLEPNTEYNILIRAKKGDTYSEYITIPNTKTRPLERGVNDIQRVPYLRMLASRRYQYGSVPQKIELFYNELAVSNAKFTYFIDDKEVTPEGYYLMLPNEGRHRLKIIVEETPDRVWNLIYKVRVAY